MEINTDPNILKLQYMFKQKLQYHYGYYGSYCKNGKICIF